jgi:arginyl-tRNA--protein-N-Asp/Glu arginylyltransferase
LSHPASHVRLPDADCRLIVVQDQLQPCPYLDGVTARMPLRIPVGSVSLEVTDQLLAMGYRRSGDFVYRPECPDCSECKATRIDVSRFRMTKSMRRVQNRGDRDLTSRWGEPTVDSKRVSIFNQHRSQRGLGPGGSPIDAESYRAFLSDSCCDTIELAISLADQLVAVAIVDTGRTSTSAVYTHFDPAAGRYCLGTYAILKQIQWARETGRRFVYLGMYVAANRHLNYKARFMPQQRLQGDQWVEVDEAYPQWAV